MKPMSECIFCQIIAGKVSSNIVYQDEYVMAFLSNHPVNPGHTLVVPKKHYENIYDISQEEVGHLFEVVKQISMAVRDAMSVEGLRIVQNNGEVGGQVIFHLHVHVIPMKLHNQRNDKVYRDPPDKCSDEALALDAQKIRQQLGGR
jgi:histidine triad (HIT) family protein